MKISVILPSYNEKANLDKGVLEQVHTYLVSSGHEFELVLADDGSTDGTVEGLREFAKTHLYSRVLECPHRGKGPTVITAIKEAQGDVRLFSDFDQATPIAELEKLLPFVEKGFDVVIGSREIQGSERKREPLHRHIMGKGFNFFVQMIAIPGIHDTQCGFKLFTKKAVDLLVDKVVVYSGKGSLTGAFTGAFDVELLFIAKKKGLKIAEVPILWKYAKTDRVDPIKDSIRMFADLLRIRIADVQGKYS